MTGSGLLSTKKHLKYSTLSISIIALVAENGTKNVRLSGARVSRCRQAGHLA